MDNKKIIITGIIILIIATSIILVMLSSVNYERIEITPNGTSIDVPANQTKYDGEIESAKIWNWYNGILVTYNSHADENIIKVTEIGFNTVNELIINNGEKQNIDNFTCYVINADELLEIHIFEVIKVNYNGKFYCIPLNNETTHDNIIICCKDKDIAVHMAKSVQYKNVYPNSDLNNTIDTAKNITGDLLSKTDDYVNNTNLSKIKSTVEEKTGVNWDDAKTELEQYTGKLPI